jgi:hypothetical protein
MDIKILNPEIPSIASLDLRKLDTKYILHLLKIPDRDDIEAIKL